MKHLVLALAFVSLVGCGVVNKSAPSSSLPVISTFTASPSSGKPPLQVTFTVDATGADHCEILSIGNVACTGTKTWVVNVSADYTLAATSKTGKTVYQVTRVTVTP